MSIAAEIPQNLVKYVNPDGTLTHLGILLFQRIIRDLERLDERVTALEP